MGLEGKMPYNAQREASRIEANSIELARVNKLKAAEERMKNRFTQAKALRDKGYSNAAIAAKMDLPESSVRHLLS